MNANITILEKKFPLLIIYSDFNTLLAILAQKMLDF